MSPLAGILIGVAAFVIMEPVTALMHRRLFHGPGMGWHASHHRRGSRGVERNDLFPVVIAAVTIAVIFVGSVVDGLVFLMALGAGATAYGATYFVVHDLYIHRRLPILPVHVGFLEPLKRAHQVHHQSSDAPFGMLAPMVPSGHGNTAGHERTAPDTTASLRHRGTRAR